MGENVGVELAYGKIYVEQKVKIQKHVGMEFCVMICFYFRLGPNNKNKLPNPTSYLQRCSV